MKFSANIISSFLAKVYNECIKTGYFPNNLKMAEVVPLNKAGPKNNCSNYCPISHLSPFAKIFKKCLHFQLYNYFLRYQLLNRNQYGFVKKFFYK